MVKESWRMTRNEFIVNCSQKLYEKGIRERNTSLKSRSKSKEFKQKAGLVHEGAVKKAIEQDEDIPDKVLDGCPELKEAKESPKFHQI